MELLVTNLAATRNDAERFALIKQLVLDASNVAELLRLCHVYREHLVLRKAPHEYYSCLVLVWKKDHAVNAEILSLANKETLIRQIRHLLLFKHKNPMSVCRILDLLKTLVINEDSASLVLSDELLDLVPHLIRDAAGRLLDKGSIKSACIDVINASDMLPYLMHLSSKGTDF